MPIGNPFHEGELLAQSYCGVADIAEKVSMIIQDEINDVIVKFLAQQYMCVAGSIDNKDNVWATLLLGKPGFISTKNTKTIHLDFTQVTNDSKALLIENLWHNPQIGILVLDTSSRTRLRINGIVQHIDDNFCLVSVHRVYGNCKKYIQKRHKIEFENNISYTESRKVNTGSTLTDAQFNLIKSADTFFVASAHPQQGIDASHRGGLPGFVNIIDRQTLKIPDYTGNNMFNTLGNFLSFPRAGLVFIDFADESTLQLTGKPVINWNRSGSEGEENNTTRHWIFHIEQWRQTKLAHYGLWSEPEYSNFNPKLNSSI